MPNVFMRNIPNPPNPPLLKGGEGGISASLKRRVGGVVILFSLVLAALPSSTIADQYPSGSTDEAQIYDTRGDQYRTGGIVNVAAPNTVINTGGQWNTYEITAQGSRLVLILNGTQTVDTTDDQFGNGPLALQYRAGTVRFRNVQIRSLD